MNFNLWYCMGKSTATGKQPLVHLCATRDGLHKTKRQMKGTEIVTSRELAGE